MRKEWRTLCETIYDCGYRLPDGRAIIRFGDLFNVSTSLFFRSNLTSYTMSLRHLFQMYSAISDKCVGNLLSARKHGYVSFEGEMLYQVCPFSMTISRL